MHTTACPSKAVKTAILQDLPSKPGYGQQLLASLARNISSLDQAFPDCQQKIMF
jgi:hypothetical protein